MASGRSEGDLSVIVALKTFRQRDVFDFLKGFFKNWKECVIYKISDRNFLLEPSRYSLFQESCFEVLGFFPKDGIALH